MTNIEGLILGLAFGYITGQITLAFFEDEIFRAFDKIRNKVRSIFGLTGG